MDSTYKLDSMDFAILAHLQADGRRSFTALADELDVSVGTVRNRYNRLVQENILHIIGWTDPVRAGFNSYARVNIEVRPTALLHQVADQLLLLQEVTFLAFTSGSYDLEINLLCKDNLQLMEVMHEKIHKVEGVYETNTTIYFKVLKWASHDVSSALTADALTTRDKSEIKEK